ncbi:MAG TPA: hypothetical protein IAC47_05305 [Candidatus Onthomorpha intestinigallinarum]|uniref:Uncharacterized protein n=1 Tax=Candidatus Onthomorpha intestinigallinarum TaxID=2840880 RepID=A0A9D1UHL1_9BACT|nr:hypothetical protein [Candidatus Onthomorpha intestinigallinarum]
MSILKSSAILAFMAIVISSCGGRGTKDSHNSDNAEQVNEQLPPVSQPRDSLSTMEVTETDIGAGTEAEAKTETETEECCDKYDNSSEDGLVYWTDSTAYASNPDLVALLDTLYRHAADSSFRNREAGELGWAREYVNRICGYYDAQRLGECSVSDYVKVCAVLDCSYELYGLKDIESYFVPTNAVLAYGCSMFREYAALLQMQDMCLSYEQEDALMAEWNAWRKFASEFDDFWSDCVLLQNYGGSISTTILNSKQCVIPNAHAEMYEPEINLVADDCWTDDGGGVFLKYAEEFFYNCCDNAIGLCFDAGTDEEVAEFYSNGNIKLYRKVAEQSELVKSLAHEWVEARNRWLEVSPVQDSRYYIRNSSEVLLQLSNMLICSINII